MLSLNAPKRVAVCIAVCINVWQMQCVAERYMSIDMSIQNESRGFCRQYERMFFLELMSIATFWSWTCTLRVELTHVKFGRGDG